MGPPDVLYLLLAAVALCDRRVWPLLSLLLANWMVNYAAIWTWGHQVGVLTDMAFGVGCIWLVRTHGLYRETWAIQVAAIYPVMLLARAFYWMMYDLGIWLGIPYFWFMVVMFSMQLFALAIPGGKRLVEHFRAWLGRLRAYWSRGAGMGAGLPVSKSEAKAGHDDGRRINLGGLVCLAYSAVPVARADGVASGGTREF